MSLNNRKLSHDCEIYVNLQEKPGGKSVYALGITQMKGESMWRESFLCHMQLRALPNGPGAPILPFPGHLHTQRAGVMSLTCVCLAQCFGHRWCSVNVDGVRVGTTVYIICIIKTSNHEPQIELSTKGPS